MFELKNEKIAIPVVLIAGLIWSFGPLVVRYMNEPNLVPWQYIFARGLTIFLIVIMTTWYLAGLVLVDIVHPLLFIGLWVPVGALFAWFAYKW